MTEKTYKISGMHCAACSSGIERFLSRQEAIEYVSVNLTTEKMLVKYDEQAISSEDIIALVQKMMYGCEEYVSAEAAAAETRKAEKEKAQAELRAQFRRAIVALCFAVPLLYVSMGHMLGAPLPGFMSMHSAPGVYALVQLVLTIPILICGRNFYTSGFPALVRLHPNMDSLVAVGTSAAFLFSIYVTVRIFTGSPDYVHSICFESSAIVVSFVMLGKALEARSKNRTGDAISRLTELAPSVARVTRYGETVELPASELKKGDIVTVLPGERFPCDGTVESGESHVDLSMLTGESNPVTIAPCEAVTGGSINLDGKIVFNATKIGAETALSQIIRMVEDAQSKKAPIAKLADTVAAYFVPAVLCIAIVASVIWALSGQSFEFVLNIFVSVLVIACPCSLGLATPTAIMAGTGRGAELKILYKSGEALQELSRVSTVLLDKTGTITQGRLKVCDISPAGDFSENELLAFTAAAEKGSIHPLAEAVLETAAERGVDVPEAGQAAVIPGKGIFAAVGGRCVLAGNAALMAEKNIEISSVCGLEDSTLIYTAVDGKYAGVISARDTIKPESTQAVSALKDLGIASVMLTGDNEGSARAISVQAGLDEFRANVLPGDKAAYVQEYRKNVKTAMVGDGINDAPALAAADVGIAIGTGTDVAIESADVVLMNGELTGLVTAVRLSKAVIRNIKQNLFWAFFYNCCGIPFAAGVFYALGGPLLHPMFAGAAMALSSITVVSNALRLRKFK